MRLRGVMVGVFLVGCATGAADDVPVIDAPPAADADPSAPDAPVADADPSAPDAAPPDASDPPSAVVSVEPAAVVLTRGASVNLTVTLDRPALAGGAEVTLASDDPGILSHAASVTVPAGAVSATFSVTGVAVGGPLDVRAELMASVEVASVRVVPALVALAPVTSSDVTLGASASYSVTLEDVTPAAVDISLSVAAPGIVTVPTTVTVPSGAAQATFPVTGAGLGGPVTIQAAVGTATVATSARVVGLYLSEVLYDVTGADDMKEWIELYNATTLPIDVTGLRIMIANTAGAYSSVLTLSGTIPAGGCATVGGPLVGAAASNSTPDGFVYLVAQDFSTDLGNAGSASGDPGDGLSLATATGDVIDNVLYGRNNDDMITDEDGSGATPPDVGDAPAAQTVERTAPGLAGPWAIQPVPSPGDCTPISM